MPKKKVVDPSTLPEAAPIVLGKLPYPHAQEILEEVEGSGWCSLDIETDGLNFVARNVVTIQIYSGKKGWVIPAWKYDTRFLVAILVNSDITKYIHNALFDGPFLTWYYGHHWRMSTRGWHGCVLRNIIDTMLNERIIKGVGGVFNLPLELRKDKVRWAEIEAEFSDSLRDTQIRYGLPALDKSLQTSFKVGEELTKQQEKYGLNDVKNLHKLAAMQAKVLKEMNLTRVADLENECVEVFIAMRVNGMNFDEKLWRDTAAANQAKLDKALKKISKMSGNAVENWNSPPQVKNYFQGEGIMIDSLTDIKNMRGQHPVLDELIELRDGLMKSVTTYGLSWLTTDWNPKKASMGEHNEPTIGPDGRIHGDFNQIVSTGRGSSSKPNLQNLPGEGPHRKCFIPTKGYKFASTDFKAQEVGIMAVASQEPVFLKALREKNDPHAILAATLYFEAEWKKAKLKTCVYPKQCGCPGHQKIRGKSKRFNFGVPYGKGAWTIAADLGISKYEAKVLLKIFEGSVSKLWKWLTNNADVAVRTRGIRTLPPFNRFRNLELEPEEWHVRNQGFNTPIQGTGGDMIKLAMVKLWRYINEHNYPAAIVLWVHDELITEAKASKATEWAKIQKRIMEEASTEILGECLIESDPKIMDYWKPKDDE